MEPLPARPLCGTWDLDPLSERVRYTPAFKQALGYAHEGDYDTTSTWRSRVHPEDLGPMKSALLAHLEGRSADYAMQFRLRVAPGEYRWVLSSGQAVARDAQGRALRMVGTMTDLGAVRHEAAQRAQAELAARAQHELRTPLNAVLGFAQLLGMQLGHGDVDLQRRHLAQLEQGGWQLLAKIERLLAETEAQRRSSS